MTALGSLSIFANCELIACGAGCNCYCQSPVTVNTTTITGAVTAPVTIRVVHDDFPRETGWSLTAANDTGIVFATLPLRSVSQSLSESVSEISLPAGVYTFTILDLAGDGICCEGGTGLYEIMVGIEVVASGGQFFFQESVNFTVTQADLIVP